LNTRVDGTLNAVFPWGNDTSLPGGSSHIFSLDLDLELGYDKNLHTCRPFQCPSFKVSGTNRPTNPDMAMKYGSREAIRIAFDEAQAVVLAPATQQLSSTTGTWAKPFVKNP
jgi:hypothetical protein